MAVDGRVGESGQRSSEGPEPLADPMGAPMGAPPEPSALGSAFAAAEPAPRRRRSPTIPPPLPADASVFGRARARAVTGTHRRPSVGVAAFDVAAAGLLARFEVGLAASPGPARAAQLNLEAARLLEHPLGRLEDALVHYRAALHATPDDLAALRGARRCLARLGASAEVVELLEREAALVPATAQKVALLRAAGRVLEGGGDPAGARARYAAALRFAPSDLSTLVATARCDRRLADWPALVARQAAALAALVDAPRLRAAWLVEQARTLEQHLGDELGAIETLLAALRADPAAAGASPALRRLLARHRRHGELATMLEAEAALHANPEARTAILLEVADLQQRHLADPDAALRVLERAADASPQSPPVLDALASHYARLARWSSLRDVLERRANTLTRPDDRVAIWYRLGALCERELDDPAEASRWYRAALSLDDGHGPSLAALARHCEASGRWRELIDLTLRAADRATAPELRAAAIARAGDLAEQHLGDVAFAIAQHERALVLCPGHQPSFTALVRHYNERQSHRELIALHERASRDAATPADAVYHLYAIAGIYEHPLAQPALAIAIYRRILALAPDRVDALHALQRAAERAERHRELIDAIDRELARGATPARAIALELHAGAVLAGPLEAPELALPRLRHALALDPSCWAAHVELERVTRRLGRWDELRAALEATLELEPTGRTAVERLLELGDIAERRLGRPDDALRFLERAVGLAPDDPGVLRTLADGLARLERWPRFAEIQRLLVLGLSGSTERAAAAHALGRVHEERLRDPVEAAAAYRLALAARADWHPALDALARLASTAAEWRTVVDALVRARAGVDDPERACTSWLFEARLRGDVLGDPEGARFCAEAAWREAPRELGALLELERLCRDAADPEALLAVERALGEALDGSPASAEPLHALAALEAAAGIDQLATLRRLVAVDEQDHEALLALERDDRSLLARVDARALASLGSDGPQSPDLRVRLAESLESIGDAGALGAWLDAVEAAPHSLAAALGLVRVAERARDDEALAVGLLHLAQLTHDPVEAARLLTWLADLRAPTDHARALDALDMALERHPDDELAVARLEALVERPDEVRRAVDVVSRATRAARDPARVQALAIRAARWWSEVLDQRAPAIAALEEALAAQPSDPRTRALLGTLYADDAQYDVALAHLELALAGAGDDAGLALAAGRDLARVLAVGTDPARALAVLEELLERWPDDYSAREQALGLRVSLGDREGARVEAERLVGHAREVSERVAALERLARIAAEDGDTVRAQAAWLEVVSLEGPSRAAAGALAALGVGQPAWVAYVAALRAWDAARVAAGADVGELTPARLEVARVLTEELGQREEALVALGEAVNRAPDALALRDALVVALLASRRASDAVRVGRALIERDPRRAESWRLLTTAFEASGRAGLARRASGALAALSGSDGKGAGVGADLPDLRPLAPDLLRRIGEEDGTGWHAERLLGALGGAVAQAEPERIAALGLAEGLWVPAGDRHPLRVVAERVGRAFAVADFELVVVASETPGGALAVPGAPPVVKVSAGLEGRSAAEQRFVFGRAFALVGRGLAALDLFDASALRALLAAGGRLVHPELPAPPGVPGPLLDGLARRLGRAVPRRGRRQVEDCVADYLRDGAVDVERWRRRVGVSATRAALLVADDLTAALGCIRRAESGAAELERDALAFWVSDLADRVRRELGYA